MGDGQLCRRRRRLAHCVGFNSAAQVKIVDCSLLETCHLSASGFADLYHELAGRPPLNVPARQVEIPSIEPTADGWVGFNTNTRQQFESFLAMIGRLDLLEDDAGVGTRHDALGAPGGVESDCAGMDDGTFHGRDRGAGLRSADSRLAGQQWPDGVGPPSVRGARRVGHVCRRQLHPPVGALPDQWPTTRPNRRCSLARRDGQK